MNTLKVSIITINYNDKVGLEKTIKSVVNQTFTNYEFIIIDGDSNDGSKELIEHYKNEITYWVSEPDDGIYNAMNKGIKIANGEYCLFLNSGDYLIDNHILMKVFKQDFDASLVYGNLIMEDENGVRVLSKQTSNITIEQLKFSSIYHSGCSFIKRKMFLDYGYYNEGYKIVSDYYFTLKLILEHNESYYYIDETMSVFNTEGISSNPKYKHIDKLERKDCQLKIASQLFWDCVDEKKYYQKKYKGLLSSKSVLIALKISKFFKK